MVRMERNWPNRILLNVENNGHVQCLAAQHSWQVIVIRISNVFHIQFTSCFVVTLCQLSVIDPHLFSINATASVTVG